MCPIVTCIQNNKSVIHVQGGLYLMMMSLLVYRMLNYVRILSSFHEVRKNFACAGHRRRVGDSDRTPFASDTCNDTRASLCYG
jgi:hypothetical protein